MYMNKADTTNKCLGCRYLIPWNFFCTLFYRYIFDATTLCDKIDGSKGG